MEYENTNDFIRIIEGCISTGQITEEQFVCLQDFTVSNRKVSTINNEGFGRPIEKDYYLSEEGLACTYVEGEQGEPITICNRLLQFGMYYVEGDGKMRLGSLEKRILNTLAQKGKACYSQDLAWELFNADKDKDEWWDKPSRAFDVSLRRAIKRLESKGLLCCGFKTHQWIDDKQKLICWLPSHEAPKVNVTADGRKIEEVIVGMLKLAKENEAIENEIQEYLKEGYNVPKIAKDYPRTPGDVPYIWLVKKVAQLIGAGGFVNMGYHSGYDVYYWARVAIGRAIRRLAKKSIVLAERECRSDEWTMELKWSRVYMVRLI